MLDRFMQWRDWVFEAPTFSDPEQTRLAKLIHNLILVTTLWRVLLSLSLVVFFGEGTRGIGLLASIGFLLLLVHLLRQGRVRMSAILLLAFIWILSTSWGFFVQEADFLIFLGYLLSVIIAAFVLSMHAATILALLSIAVLIGRFVIIYNGLLPTPPVSGNPLANVTISLMPFAVILLVLHVSTTSLSRALREARHSARDLRRRNRAYQVLSQSNQSLIRATNKDLFLQQICDILVNHADYQMACITLRQDNGEDLIETLAGGTTADAQRLHRWLPPRQEGQFETQVIHPGDDSEFHSLISLALVCDDSLHGTLNVCTTETDAFEESERLLLEEMALDVAHGLETLEARHQQETMQDQLNYQAGLLDQISDVIMSIDADRVVQSWNNAAAHRYGLSADEAVGMLVYDIFTAEYPNDSPEEVYRTIEETGTWEGEMIHELKDGRRIHVMISVNKITDSNGNTGGVVSVSRDITERIRIQEALRISEDRLKRFLDSSPDVIFICDADFNILDANAALLALEGYQRHELIGKNLRDVNTIFKDPVYLDDFSKVIATGTPLYKTGATERADSGTRLLKIQAIKVGEGVGVIVSDVTEQRRIEHERERFFNMSPDIISIRRFDGSGILVNPAMSRILGYSQEELMKMDPMTQIHPDDQQLARDELGQLTEGRAIYDLELRYIAKDGAVKWLSWSAAPYLEEGLAFSIARDITERKENEARLALFVESTNDGIVIYDHELRTVEVNRTVVQQMNTSRDALLGTYILDNAPHLKATGRLAQLEQVIETGEPMTYEDVLTPEMTGGSESRIIQIKAFRVGSGLGLVSTDVTDLRRSEQDRERIFMMANDAMCIIDFDGTFIQVNPALAILMGRSEEEMIGATAIEWILPEYLDFALSALGSVTQGQSITSVELPYSLKDGTVRWISWSATPDMDQQIVFAVGRDMTDIHATQAALIENERLEAELRRERELSELKNWFMSLVSHEFRTPLTIIQSSSEIIRRYMDRMSDEVRERHLNHIVSQVGQLNAMLADYSLVLHAQDGRLEFQPAPQDVVSFCRDLVEEYQLSIQSDHTLNFICDDAIDLVQIDNRFLGYTLRNLLSNAIKYSPNGNKVDLTLRSTGDQLVFEVRDEGIGIPPEAQESIFDAYQRAQNVGDIHGTGIGLNIARLCVESHGGEISLHSEIDQGSTFTVKLPLVLAQTPEWE